MEASTHVDRIIGPVDIRTLVRRTNGLAQSTSGCARVAFLLVNCDGDVADYEHADAIKANVTKVERGLLEPWASAADKERVASQGITEPTKCFECGTELGSFRSLWHHIHRETAYSFT